MIRYTGKNQLALPGFESTFDRKLNVKNRWVVLAELIPWDEMAGVYAQHLNPSLGRYGVDIRRVLGAMIIKHKENFSDRATVSNIEENIYMQYFCGYSSFSNEPPFDASLFVDIRKRMGHEVFEKFNSYVISTYEKLTEKKRKKIKDKDGEDKGSNNVLRQPPEQEKGSEQPCQTEEQAPHKGKLKLDATVADQYIKYPTDLNLLNESRENTERMIDKLVKILNWQNKPRIYRRKARRLYLGVVKKKCKTRKEIRKAIREQLQFVRRNIAMIHKMLDQFEADGWPLTKRDQRLFWVIQHLYAQQKEMYDNKTNKCSNRIVSIHQPHVRPIVRGKDKNKAEFGAKLSVSEHNGMCVVDHIHWEATHEAGDLPSQVEAYKNQHGYYPEVVIVDKLYMTRANRAWLKSKGIRCSGKPLGRPPKTEKTACQKRKERKEQAERNHIEGKFGQGKNAYGLNKIRAKLKETSESWICAIFLVMNLTKMVKECAGKVQKRPNNPLLSVDLTWLTTLLAINYKFNRTFTPVYLSRQLILSNNIRTPANEY